MTPRHSLKKMKSEESFNVNEGSIVEELSYDKMSWGSQNNDVFHEIIQDLTYHNYSRLNSNILFSDDFWKLPPKIEQKRQEIIDNEWGGYALDVNLWNDTYKSLEKSLNNDFELNNSEYCGILSDRMVEACKSFLTKSQADGQYILGKCELKNMNLVDISTLRHHQKLQYLDLSHNNLGDLTALGELTYLMYLNASYNKIKEILHFSPSWYLTHVYLSHNQISKMNDITQFWSIVELDLSYNNIEKISGLQNLKYLKTLNFSYNFIKCVENLNNLKLKKLNLEGNNITSFKFSNAKSAISNLFHLNTLILGYNGLSSLEFLKDSHSLRHLDLRHNKITDLLEITNLKGSIYEIDLRGNPCTKWSSYKNVLLHSLPNVKYLDGTEVSISEKVSATALFAPSVNLLASQSITKLYLLEQLSAPKIDYHVIPYDQAIPPLIILCGPCTIKKMALAVEAAEKLFKRVRYCRNHTTRENPINELEKKSYIFIDRENFNEMTKKGEFLSVHELLGHSYGFHYSEVAQTVAEEKIGITHLDLNATLQLQSRYPNIKTVLVLTQNEDIHRKWISEKFEIYPWLKSSIQNLLTVKVGSSSNLNNFETFSNSINFISQIVDQVIDNLNNPESMLSSINFISQMVDQVISNLNVPESSLSTINFISQIVDQVIDNLNLSNLTTRSINFISEIVDQIIDNLNSNEIKTLTEKLEVNKHITFQEDDNSVLLFKNNKSISESDLMIILDEKSNVMIDEKKIKRKKQNTKMHFYRNLSDSVESFIFESLENSLSSEETVNVIPCLKLEKYDLQQMFVEIIIKSRQLYIQQHQNEPGFFSLVLFSDEYITAFNSLINFIYETYVNYPLSKFTNSIELSYMVQKVIPRKIQSIIKELKKS